MSKKQERQTWLLKNIPTEGIDILCSEFVDKFVTECNVPYKSTNWGANKCPVLNKLLNEMYRNKLLKRGIIGLTGGSWQPGFPKWVYTYEVIK